MTFDSLQATELATRRLRFAIVTSLLVHLLILWPTGVRMPTKDTPAPLQATLRTSPQPPGELAPPEPPRAAPPARTLATPRPRPESQALERPNAPSVPQTLAAPAEAVPKPSSASDATPVATAPPSAPAAVASASLVTEATASGEAVDGLRSYRLALATQARRFKRYPAQAMASGWAGTADIRVEVGSDGRPRAATLVRSSGYEVLDRAALTMIDAGALRARVPESLRGRAFVVVLPVVFNLDDE